jgi:hypothetical protein
MGNQYCQKCDGCTNCMLANTWCTGTCPGSSGHHQLIIRGDSYPSCSNCSPECDICVASIDECQKCYNKNTIGRQTDHYYGDFPGSDYYFKEQKFTKERIMHPWLHWIDYENPYTHTPSGKCRLNCRGLWSVNEYDQEWTSEYMGK